MTSKMEDCLRHCTCCSVSCGEQHIDELIPYQRLILVLSVKAENERILLRGLFLTMFTCVLECFLDEVVRIASDDAAGLSIARSIV